MNKRFALFLALVLVFQTVTASAASNYEFGIIVSRPVPTEVKATMSLEEIASLKTVNDQIKAALLKSLKEEQSSLMRLALLDSKLVRTPGAGISLLDELTATIARLNVRLLRNLKDIQPREEMNFQIHVAPILSPILLTRRLGDPVTPKFLYPNDRLTVVDVFPKSEPPTRGDTGGPMVGDIYAGIASRLQDGYTRQPDNPFFVALALSLKVKKQLEKSQITAQVVLGTPVNRAVPFTQANDQIRFKTIEFPRFDAQEIGMSAEKLPAAIVTIEQELSARSGRLLVDFGPVTRFDNGRWARSGGSAGFRDLAPKLIGTPAGVAANRVDIVFNVLNVIADTESRGVADLDLFISIGVPAMRSLRAGWMNKTQIDDQFRTEINKSVQQAIQEQNDKLHGATAAINGITPANLNQILTQIFTVKAGQ